MASRSTKTPSGDAFSPCGLLMSGFYTVAIALPPGMDQAQAARLGAAFTGPDVVSHTLEDINLSGESVWRVSWLVAGEERPARSEALARLCVAAAVCGMVSEALDPQSLSIEPVPDIDWLAHVHRAHPPFQAGRFFVRSSGWTTPPPAGLIPLDIDAVTAFGSGEHGTTAGCLGALGFVQDTGFAPGCVLDMGTGSGILAIAAWKLWGMPVVAVDMDREAVKVARLHGVRNGVPSGARGLSCHQGRRFSIGAIVRRRPFDLILANILAAPLKEMAEDMIGSLRAGGYAILSGMTCAQKAEVADVYRGHGACPVPGAFFDRGIWATLVLQKKA